MKRRGSEHRKKKMPQIVEYWQSYADMMAALLLVFILLITVTVAQTKESYEEQLKKDADYRAQIQDQQRQLNDIIGVRADIVRRLANRFSDSNLGVTVNPETGAISFDSSILFDYDKYELKESGIQFLNQFFPIYFEVILEKGIRENVSEIIIEGHTDDQGDYLYNLELSQKRALSVAGYCLKEDNSMFSENVRDELRSMVTANGRSSSDPIRDENQNVDAEKSRRVEIKFRLREDEMIRQMQEILENAE